MKQTAVQWLETILERQKDKPFDFDEWSIAFEHAKQLEKEQIMDAFNEGFNEGCRYTTGFEQMLWEDDEQYYNETFKSE